MRFGSILGRGAMQESLLAGRELDTLWSRVMISALVVAA
jgi:hypothetical protein